MTVKLDTPNPAMDEEAIAEVNANNVKQLRSTINKNGVNVLAQVVANTYTSVGGLTNTKLTIGGKPFEAVITSSGGLVEFDFYTTVEQDAGGSLFKAFLYIDGQVVRTSVVGATAAVAGMCVIRHKVKLGEGRHTVYIAVTTTGTNNVCFQSSDTLLLVSETVL